MTVSTNYLQNVLGDDDSARMAIREIPHFRKISGRTLDCVFRYGRVVSLEQGEDLIREGEFDQWVYFVLSGRMTVLVGTERVDTINSSLVGERCILGEPRGATLQADEGGITALGIDMALLDSLQQGQGSAEDAAVMVELLSVIAVEVVRRVADLAINEIDMSTKHAVVLNVENTCAMLEALRDEKFSDSRQFNLEVYKFLRRTDPWMLARVIRDGTLEVDTRALYSRCVDQGRHELLMELAEKLAGFIAARSKGETKPDKPQLTTFQAFAKSVGHIVAGRAPTNGALNGAAQVQAHWRRYFRLDRDMTVDLGGLCTVLKRQAGFGDRHLIDLLLTIVRESSGQTGRINANIQAMVRELNQVGLAKRLMKDDESAPSPYFYDTHPIEDMIPVFSRHILDVHLINPYQTNLQERATDTLGGSPKQETGELLDALFE